MRTVAIESPFKADAPEQARLHQEYLERVIRHELRSGNAPFASHTQPQPTDTHHNHAIQ